jgi:hypothetical protein
MPAEQQHAADQHYRGGQQHQQQHVVERVQSPHAASDLAHGGAGKAVGVPVRRKALHAVEGTFGDGAHQMQGEGDDAAPSEVAQRDHAQAQQCHDYEGSDCGRARGGSSGERIDHAPGVQRNEDFGERCQRHCNGNAEGQRGTLLPESKGKGQDFA